jgi:DNA-binding transcriptional regulator YiaG
MERMMVRPYSDRFLLGLQHADLEHTGIQLAQLCIKAKVPNAHVANVLGITRKTVHDWFRGGKIRQKTKPKLERLYKLIEQGLADGKLPTPNYTATKVFMESEVKPMLVVAHE